MQPTDLVLVYTPVGGGHKAAALAIAEVARARGLRVEILDLFDYAPPIVGRSYLAAHFTGQRALPNVYGAAYSAANHRDGIFEPVRRGVDHVAFAPLAKHVTAISPRAIIATHHLPLVVLGDERATGPLEAPLVGVVTDYTAHACWAERGVDAFAVACARAERDLIGHGIEADRIHRTGIPVRPAFETIADIVPLSSGRSLRVLITSGGYGVGPLRAIVRSFAGVPRVELTVVCGDSPALVERVTRDADALKICANVLGFERDMPRRVAAAHVVVGKAGGLTVSETMAAGRPMIVVGAVPGNESINEEMVVSNGAGCAARAEEVGPVVAWLRGTKGALAAMGERARHLVIAGAAGRVIDIASEACAFRGGVGAGFGASAMPEGARRAASSDRMVAANWPPRRASGARGGS